MNKRKLCARVWQKSSQTLDHLATTVVMFLSRIGGVTHLLEAGAQSTVTDDQPRNSSSSPPRMILAGAASAAISMAVMGFLWKEQPFFAAAAVALYIMGGVRVVPWKTPIRKAIAIGIFLGIAVSSAMFYWDFLGSVA
jgi:hypothetical protein